jgi:serine/threonine protein kinase
MVSYAEDILQGLKYIHNKGIIHDDIKLDNILMATTERDDEYNTAKICDFGLSQLVDPKTGKSKMEVKCGTMGYMAPEVKAVSLNFN